MSSCLYDIKIENSHITPGSQACLRWGWYLVLYLSLFMVMFLKRCHFSAGNLWTIGLNQLGQLGHHDTQSQKLFSKIERLPRIKQIAVGGGQHMVALAYNGTVRKKTMPFNSSPPSAAYMRQWIGSALVQLMACRLFGAKPFSKQMLGYCQLDP